MNWNRHAYAPQQEAAPIRPFQFPPAITDLSQVRFLVKDGRPENVDVSVQTMSANHASQNVSVRQLDQALGIVKLVQTKV